MIRKANINDIDIIMDIWLNANVSAHDFIPKSYWEEHFNDVREAISNAEVYVFDDSGVKAFVGLLGNYIAGVFVDEKHRSRGIGATLIKYVQNIKNELSLNVYEKNKAAVSFYIKHGFEISGKNIDKNTNQSEYLMRWKH